MQFSFPYQLAFPLLIFGLYGGLISNHLDDVSKPIWSLKFSISKIFKKIIYVATLLFFGIGFYYTYFLWIQLYDKLDEINLAGEFDRIDVVQTPVYHIGVPYILNHLGGKFFNNGQLQSI